MSKDFFFFVLFIFTNWNINAKYFSMNFFSGLSAKNYLLSLLCSVRVKAHFPLEIHLFIFFRLLFRLLAVLSGTLTVESRNVLSANNLGLHLRSSDKLLVYIKKKKADPT